MPEKVESSFFIPMAVNDAETYNSLAEGNFVVNEYRKFPKEVSLPSIAMSQVLISEGITGATSLTAHSIEDNQWFLSIDEQEWNSFILRQIFDDL